MRTTARAQTDPMASIYPTEDCALKERCLLFHLLLVPLPQEKQSQESPRHGAPEKRGIQNALKELTPFFVVYLSPSLLSQEDQMVHLHHQGFRRRLSACLFLRDLQALLVGDRRHHQLCQRVQLSSD